MGQGQSAVFAGLVDRRVFEVGVFLGVILELIFFFF
jgi:hypothetical protein